MFKASAKNKNSSNKSQGKLLMERRFFTFSTIRFNERKWGGQGREDGTGLTDEGVSRVNLNNMFP